MKRVYLRLSETMGERLKTCLCGLMTVLCVAGIVSCSSDDAVEDTPAGAGMVKTQFVLSVSTANGASTRMSDVNTQALSTSAFRGIDNAKLLGYKLTDNGQQITTATATAPSKIYDLGDVLAANAITAADARHVQSLDMELNTNTLLFYGKAIKNGTDQQQGKIDFHVGNGGSDTYFELQPRVSDTEVHTQYETALKAILNDVLGAKSGTTGWANYGASYQDPSQKEGMTVLEKTLGEAYSILTTIGVNEARAGSGSAILRTIDDVWKYVAPVAETSDESNATVVDVAKDIVAKLNAHFEYVSEQLQFKAYTSGDFSLTSEQLGAFPVNLNLPAGAEQLIYTGGQFDFKSSAALGMESGTPVGNIMWPAELCYFGNSPVRTSTASKSKEDLPATVDNWDADAGWTGFEKDSKVLPSTRTVAMQNAINYGTALLATTVKYNAATLNDNNSGIHTGENDNTIDAATASPFQLTGILVGGQYNRVGWDYLPLITSATDAYVIYDNDLSEDAQTIPAYTETPTASATNYTLVFDNYVPGESQKSVFVCLEFKNNSGKDFYGESNLIAKGETFYLIGKLQLPESPSVPRVFMQDYVTKANFVIGANSLKKAYNVMPNLMSPRLELGLVVADDWVVVSNDTHPVYNW